MSSKAIRNLWILSFFGVVPPVHATDHLMLAKLLSAEANVYTANEGESTWRWAGIYKTNVDFKKDSINFNEKYYSTKSWTGVPESSAQINSSFESKPPYHLIKSQRSEFDSEQKSSLKFDVQKDAAGKYQWTMQNNVDGKTAKKTLTELTPNLTELLALQTWVLAQPKILESKLHNYSDCAPTSSRQQYCPFNVPYRSGSLVTEIMDDPSAKGHKIYKVKTTEIAIDDKPGSKPEDYRNYTSYIGDDGDLKAIVMEGSPQTTMIFGKLSDSPIKLKIAAPTKSVGSVDFSFDKSAYELGSQWEYELEISGPGSDQINYGPHQDVRRIGDKTIVSLGASQVPPSSFHEVRGDDNSMAEASAVDSPELRSYFELLKTVPKQKERALAIAHFVTREMTYCNSQAEEEPSIGWVKDYKLGDCTEFSKVTVAALRLAGFKARVVTGYVIYDGDQIEGHNWVEVFVDNKWHSMEPQGPVWIGADEPYVKGYSSPNGDNAQWMQNKDLKIHVKKVDRTAILRERINNIADH